MIKNLTKVKKTNIPKIAFNQLHDSMFVTHEMFIKFSLGPVLIRM